MPRTNIAALDASDRTFPWKTAGLQITGTAADVANKNESPADARVMLIARNSGASSRTVTITSAPDNRTGRSGDVVKTVAAGESWLWTLVPDGWAHGTTNRVYQFEANHADILFTLVKLN